MRNLIIETPSSPGNFAKVALVIGTFEGDMGDIQTIKIGTQSTIRDVSINCRDEAHLMQIVEAINKISEGIQVHAIDRKSTRLNSSHVSISYAVFCLKKKIQR